VAVTNEDFSHGLDALFGNLSSLTAHCGKGNMGFVPISSSQNEWNNNHIGVPSFILSGAPVFDYSGTKLGATEVPAALRSYPPFDLRGSNWSNRQSATSRRERQV
jgi:hypothetical protein